MPDFERPTMQVVPVDFAVWNGRTIHPMMTTFADQKFISRKNFENALPPVKSDKEFSL